MADLFISYNRADRVAVEALKQRLSRSGVTTFFDSEQLVAGMPWPAALEDGLAKARAVAVFIGPSGLGAWQKREMYFALDRQVELQKQGRAYPVIPVLLPASEVTAGFLFLNAWIDFRRDLNDAPALDGLLKAVHSTESPRERGIRVDISPYLGLRAFKEEDAALFFGRERAVQEVLNKLSSGFVAIVAPSGMGKSSVLRAGVVPALRRHRPPAPTWDVAIFTPRTNPWLGVADCLLPLLEPELSEARRLNEAATLATGLAATPDALARTIDRLVEKSRGTDRLLLGIDQFEELLTQVPEADRKPFLNAVIHATRTSPVTVVATLRADYYGVALNFGRELTDVLNTAQVALGELTREELEATIVKPAQLAGLSFEAGLVDVIAADVEGQAGGLALLEYALTALWQERREDGTLTHGAYGDSGRVRNAITARAEGIYSDLKPDEQRAARRLFGRLVRVSRPNDEGTDTRRRATRTEVGDEAWSVAEKYAAPNQRLLVFGTTSEEGTGTPEERTATVEVAHEAIIRSWRRLNEWLDDDRPFLLWRQQLDTLLPSWRATKALLPKELAHEASSWLSKRKDDLTAEERTFIDESRQAIRYRRVPAIAMAAAALVAAIGLVFVETTRSHLAVDFGAEDRVVVRQGVAALTFLPWPGRGVAADSGLVRADVADQSLLGPSRFAYPAERADILLEPFVLDRLVDSPPALLLRYAGLEPASTDRDLGLLRRLYSVDDAYLAEAEQYEYRDSTARFILSRNGSELLPRILSTLGGPDGRTLERSLPMAPIVQVALLDERLAPQALEILAKLLDVSGNGRASLLAFQAVLDRFPRLKSGAVDALIAAYTRWRDGSKADDFESRHHRQEIAMALAAWASSAPARRAEIVELDLHEPLFQALGGFRFDDDPLGHLIRFDPSVLSRVVTAEVELGPATSGRKPIIGHLVSIVEGRASRADPSDAEKAAINALGTAAAIKPDLRSVILRTLIASHRRGTRSVNTGNEPEALAVAVGGDQIKAREVMREIGSLLTDRDATIRYRAVRTIAEIGSSDRALSVEALGLLLPRVGELFEEDSAGQLARLLPMLPSLPEAVIVTAVKALQDSRERSSYELAAAVTNAGGYVAAQRLVPAYVSAVLKGYDDGLGRSPEATAQAFAKSDPRMCSLLVAPFGAAMTDVDLFKRGRAAVALSHAAQVDSNCSQQVVPILLQAANSERDDARRVVVFEALSAISGEQSLKQRASWESFMADRSLEVRRAAQKVLMRFLLQSGTTAADPLAYFTEQLSGAPSNGFREHPNAIQSAYYREALAGAAAKWIVDGPETKAADRKALRATLERVAAWDSRVLIRLAAVRALSLVLDEQLSKVLPAGE